MEAFASFLFPKLKIPKDFVFSPPSNYDEEDILSKKVIKYEMKFNGHEGLCACVSNDGKFYAVKDPPSYNKDVVIVIKIPPKKVPIGVVVKLVVTRFYMTNMPPINDTNPNLVSISPCVGIDTEFPGNYSGDRRIPVSIRVQHCISLMNMVVLLSTSGGENKLNQDFKFVCESRYAQIDNLKTSCFFKLVSI